jgi:hypothetical protein
LDCRPIPRAALALLVAACSNTPVSGPDAARDLTERDYAAPADLTRTTSLDLTPTDDLTMVADSAMPDLATPDLATSDLAMPDLAMPDLVAPPDFKCPGFEVSCNGACVDVTSDPTNCGACANMCAIGASCTSGMCVCPAGQTGCNGICVDFTSDNSNCGSCGHACPTGSTCVASLCQCNPGLVSCAMSCADLSSDPANCGGCGNACDMTNSLGAMCGLNGCTYTGCHPGFADCMNMAPDYDGCETPTNTVNSCGGCGNVCNIGNANSASCDGVKCSYTCQNGFADCIMIGANTDGCETPTNTIANCTGCGNVCDGTNSVGARCNGTTCSYTGCKAGFADCLMGAPDLDGCETNITSITNCGGCGLACDVANSNGARCAGGCCMYTSCKTGFADCVTTCPDLDGCETATITVNNCGGCNNVCNLSNATGASCDGVKCSYTCKNGFADCVMIGANTDGCETATTTTTNCGGCGNQCDALHSLGAACNGTMCTYTGCVNGWVDCDMSGANANGCESQIHINGLGQTFSDCADPIGTPGNAGTYNVNMATLARAAWIITSPSDTAGTCNLGQDNCVVRGNSSTCSIWCYSGPDAGYVHTNNAKACVCPVAGSDVTWY